MSPTSVTRSGLTPRPPAESARGIAMEAMLAVAEGARANEILPELLSRCRLEQRDRAFATGLVYGACRMQRALDWLADRHLRGQCDQQVRAALRLGAYQLVWLKTPAHAAVSATVAEVRGPGRAVVNAVLRKIAAQARGGIRWPDPATRLSYPDWIVKSLVAELGLDDALAALETMNTPASATVREDGYVQDRASQMVSSLAAGLLRQAGGDTSGGIIIDLCAAPGGKATALAGSAGLVVAADVDHRRASRIAENVSALGLKNVSVVVADGLAPPWRQRSADLVLVDAPCSGLGVLRRRPDARWRIKPDDLPRLAELQRGLISQALSIVRPGGIIVYCVCTLTSTETTSVARSILGHHDGLTLLDVARPPWRAVPGGSMILPQDGGTDGMYVFAIRAPDQV